MRNVFTDFFHDGKLDGGFGRECGGSSGEYLCEGEAVSDMLGCNWWQGNSKGLSRREGSLGMDSK